MSGAGEQLEFLAPGSVNGSGSGSGSFDHEPPEVGREGWFLKDRPETQSQSFIQIWLITLYLLLVPVIRDKASKLNNMENYRPIALTILLTSLEMFVLTTDSLALKEEI